MVCLNCVQRELKKNSHAENLLAWPVARFKTALSEQGGVQDRLTVLWNFSEVYRYTEAKNAKEQPELLRLLIENLGYIQPHPLAQTIRQAAFQACVRHGKACVPLLLARCQPTPWQFYVNVLMALGKLAPEDHEVQQLLQQASQDENPEVRSRVQELLNKEESAPHDKHDILSTVLRKLDPALRQFVQIGVPTSEKTPKGKPEPAPQPPSPPPLPYIPGQRAIQDLLLQLYTVDALRKIYLCYVRDLFSPEDFPEGRVALNKLKKEAVAWAIARVYADTTLFQRFFSGLSEEVKTILNLLVWEHHEYDVSLLESTFQREILKAGSSSRYSYGNPSQDIHDQYNLFLIRREYRLYGFGMENPYTYYFYLPDSLKKLFKGLLPTPAEYHLTPLPTVKETNFVYANADRILLQLPLIYTYLEQGNLKVSKTGKVLKNSMAQMTKYCGLDEFYADSVKDLAYLRTRLLLDFCQAIRPDQPITGSPESLKQVFQVFFEQATAYKLCFLLWHLQGIKYVAYYNQKQEELVRASVRTLLRTLPVNQWFAADRLVQYCIYRDLSLEIVERSAASQYLSFNKQGAYYYDSRVPITGGMYKDALLTPFLKGLMFLLAAFGLVELAYTMPENSVLQRMNKSYLSVFDGLQAARLTALGAYVAGQTDAYTASLEAEPAHLMLDDRRLLITLDKPDRMKALMLSKIAEKISDTCYTVTYQSFLKECSSTADVKKKIALFHDHLSTDPPPIWQAFLEDVLAKMNPLTPVRTMSVYRLTPNKELIALMARDEELKQYLLKAEDYHIVVEARQIAKVKKRLEAFGYFIDNL